MILSRRGEAFAQRRSPGRRLFPDTWDVVGGHVERDESLLAVLAREAEEETGWRLRRVCRLLGVTSWTGDDGGGLRHDADYVGEVDGDLGSPDWSGRSTPPTTGSAPPTPTFCPPSQFMVHDLIIGVLCPRDDGRSAT
ncbi:NUDIX domain-containing protein [Streptomyces sp. NPDC047061]|uniref:NUDIX hydrolase n=1 Tax=Streptomyces sp. NPDC047061 TaxID=3154605 RepID=UPI0033E42A2B